MKQTDGTKSKDHSVVLFVVSAVAVTATLFLNWCVLHYRGAETRGSAGSMFGVSAALFSGLGFAAIVITLYNQRRQILDSQEASRDQLNELINQRRLSLMPTFVIQPPSSKGPEPELINIGNGAAVNIVLADFSVIVQGRYRIDSISHKVISYLPPTMARGLWPDRSVPPLTEGEGRDQTADRIRHAFDNEKFELKVTFDDIEGRRYEQLIRMDRSICRPSPVRRLNEDS